MRVELNSPGLTKVSIFPVSQIFSLFFLSPFFFYLKKKLFHRVFTKTKLVSKLMEHQMLPQNSSYPKRYPRRSPKTWRKAPRWSWWSVCRLREVVVAKGQIRERVGGFIGPRWEPARGPIKRRNTMIEACDWLGHFSWRVNYPHNIPRRHGRHENERLCDRHTAVAADFPRRTFKETCHPHFFGMLNNKL